MAVCWAAGLTAGLVAAAVGGSADGLLVAAINDEKFVGYIVDDVGDETGLPV